MDYAAVFIDGGYLDKVQESLKNIRMDYEKFSDILCENFTRFRTYYYHCMPYQENPPTLEQKGKYQSMSNFIHSLRKLPRFEVRLGRLERRGDGFKQKQVDTLIAIDLVKLSAKNQIKKAVLVSGDSDHVPAIRSAKEDFVLVKLCYMPGTVHSQLVDICDERLELGMDILGRCLRK
jgi:uncharacterized LabA/DUF88 family protein